MASLISVSALCNFYCSPINALIQVIFRNTTIYDSRKPLNGNPFAYTACEFREVLAFRGGKPGCIQV